MMSIVEIREMEKADHGTVARINQSVVEHMSPMDEARLEELLRYCSYARIAVSGGEIVGFVLAMPESRAYVNDNYAWFSDRYAKFLYIDRVAISPGHEGKGIGSRIYEDLFASAREAGIGIVACEINVVPPNHQSLAFHGKFGFAEVGRQTLSSGKTVSMQISRIE